MNVGRERLVLSAVPCGSGIDVWRSCLCWMLDERFVWSSMRYW